MIENTGSTPRTQQCTRNDMGDKSTDRDGGLW